MIYLVYNVDLGYCVKSAWTNEVKATEVCDELNRVERERMAGVYSACPSASNETILRNRLEENSRRMYYEVEAIEVDCEQVVNWK